jgi:hypothetical protein
MSKSKDQSKGNRIKAAAKKAAEKIRPSRAAEVVPLPVQPSASRAEKVELLRQCIKNDDAEKLDNLLKTRDFIYQVPVPPRVELLERAVAIPNSKSLKVLVGTLAFINPLYLEDRIGVFNSAILHKNPQNLETLRGNQAFMRGIVPEAIYPTFPEKPRSASASAGETSEQPAAQAPREPQKPVMPAPPKALKLPLSPQKRLVFTNKLINDNNIEEVKDFLSARGSLEGSNAVTRGLLLRFVAKRFDKQTFFTLLNNQSFMEGISADYRGEALRYATERFDNQTLLTLLEKQSFMEGIGTEDRKKVEDKLGIARASASVAPAPVATTRPAVQESRQRESPIEVETAHSSNQSWVKLRNSTEKSEGFSRNLS